MTDPIVNIWTTSSDARFNQASGRAPAYLTRAQACRFERIMQARQLYNGDHVGYFLHGGRTVFDFPQERAGERIVYFYIAYNLLRRFVTISADLLFGAEPIIRVEDDFQDQKLKELLERTHFHALLMELEIECGFAGEGVLEACIQNGETYLVQIPAEQIHPVGDMGPDRQYAEYVRYAETNVGTSEQPIKLLLVTRYRIGSIERHCYQLDTSETPSASNEVALDSWPAFAGKTMQSVETTGIAMNTIIWFPNLLHGGKVKSDFDGLLDLQDQLNAKQTQLARVFKKHADPKLRAPRAAADSSGNIRGDQDVLYADNPQDWGYVTWNAEVPGAMADRDFVVDAMCVESETSPVLLGIGKSGTPESARALRLRATTSTAKAQRKATLRRPLIKRALQVAQMLEQTIQGNRFAVGPVAVEPRDGLPIDDSDRAQTIATLRAAGALSQERAIEMQIDDPAAQRKELALLQAEAAASTPSVLLGDPAAQSTNTPPDAMTGGA